MTLVRFVPLAVVLVLAGCASPDAGVDTLPLGLPPPTQLLPAAIPGYSLGYETGTPMDGGGATLDSLTRIFDGQQDGTGMQIATSVTRFGSSAGARQYFEHVVDSMPENASRAALGDDARHTERPGHEHTVLVVRKDITVWVAQFSFTPRGGSDPPSPDLVALLAPYVERAPSASASASASPSASASASAPG